MVTDRELTPAQARDLELLLDLPVSDRSELILDIFAQRAASAAGRLQGASAYQRVVTTLPARQQAIGDNALDADEQWFYFRVGAQAAARHYFRTDASRLGSFEAARLAVMPFQTPITSLMCWSDEKLTNACR